jgi:hypothetical protein
LTHALGTEELVNVARDEVAAVDILRFEGAFRTHDLHFNVYHTVT